MYLGLKFLAHLKKNDLDYEVNILWNKEFLTFILSLAL